MLSYEAREQLALMLAEAESPDDAVMRVSFEGGGFGFAIDRVQPGGETFAHADKTVLAIDEQIAEMLTNKKLDVEFTGDEPELALTEQQGLN